MQRSIPVLPWVSGLKKFNPELLLLTTNTYFVAYGTKMEVPIIGKIKVHHRNNAVYKVAATLYVTEDQEEFLLEKVDAMALGILSLNLDGRTPERETSYGSKQAPPTVARMQHSRGRHSKKGKIRGTRAKGPGTNICRPGMPGMPPSTTWTTEPCMTSPGSSGPNRRRRARLGRGESPRPDQQQRGVHHCLGRQPGRLQR